MEGRFDQSLKSQIMGKKREGESSRKTNTRTKRRIQTIAATRTAQSSRPQLTPIPVGGKGNPDLPNGEYHSYESGMSLAKVQGERGDVLSGRVRMTIAKLSEGTQKK